MKRFLAVILAVVMMCSLFTGCDELPVEEVLEGFDLDNVINESMFPDFSEFFKGLNIFAMFEPKSDEDLIYERIDSFLYDYNSGDMDALMDNFDSKMRNMTEGILGIGGSILGEITGFDMDIGDMFGLSMGILGGEGDVLTARDIDIVELEDDRAEVYLELVFDAGIDELDAASQPLVFIMTKEGSDWFISGMIEG